MVKGNHPCSCVADCTALREIANSSGNLRSLFLDQLAKGTIGVYSGTWKEFSDLYEEDAELLEPYISKKINISQKYRIGAASIADKLNSSLSHGPYDNYSDLYTASICSTEGYFLITTEREFQKFSAMKCCSVRTLVDWAENQEVS